MKEKNCIKCKNLPKRNNDSSYCKKCHSEYQRAYYKNTLGYNEKRKKQWKERKNEIRKLVILEKDKPCADCGIKYPYYVMDFDHTRDKKFNLSVAARHQRSLKSVMEEIEKCEVVCANCHRIRTFTRIGESTSGR